MLCLGGTRSSQRSRRITQFLFYRRQSPSAAYNNLQNAIRKKGNRHSFSFFFRKDGKKRNTTIIKRNEERRGRVLSIIPPNYGCLFFPVENHSSSFSFTHVLRGETWKRSAASKQYKNKVKSYDMEEVDSRVYSVAVLGKKKSWVNVTWYVYVHRVGVSFVYSFIFLSFLYNIFVGSLPVV